MKNKKDDKPQLLPWTIFVDVLVDRRGYKKAKKKGCMVKDDNIVQTRFHETEFTLNEAINKAHKDAKSVYGYVSSIVVDTKNFTESFI